MQNDMNLTTEQNTAQSKGRRVGLFVDMANIERNSKDNGDPGARLNFSALISFANKRGRVIHRNLYTSYRPGIDERRLAHLRQQGWRIVRAPLREGRNGEGKTGNMDAAMGFDAGLEARRLNENILVSGDGDFVPLIDRLHRLGKRVIVIGLDGSDCHPGLIIEADEFFRLSQVPGFFSKPPDPQPVRAAVEVVAELSNRDTYSPSSQSNVMSR